MICFTGEIIFILIFIIRDTYVMQRLVDSFLLVSSGYFPSTAQFGLQSWAHGQGGSSHHPPCTANRSLRSWPFHQKYATMRFSCSLSHIKCYRSGNFFRFDSAKTYFILSGFVCLFFCLFFYLFLYSVRFIVVCHAESTSFEIAGNKIEMNIA